MSNGNDVSTIQTLYQKAHALLATANPLTIPNYNSVTFDEARRIITQVDAGNIRQAQVILMAHAFDLDNRARRLTYFYPTCDKCKDFLRIFEAATLSLAQENYDRCERPRINFSYSSIVAIRPGETALTRTGASSSAKPRASASSAALIAP